MGHMGSVRRIRSVHARTETFTSLQIMRASFRPPRRATFETHAISSSTSILTADYNRAIEEMKKRYGPEAQTGTFSDARGLFVIGPRGHTASIFPFQIDPRQPPKPGMMVGPGVEYLNASLIVPASPRLARRTTSVVCSSCLTARRAFSSSNSPAGVSSTNDSWVVGFWRAGHGRQTVELERRACALA
jgi:hypothetical protein